MLIVVTASLAVWLNAQTAPATSEPVWSWFATCGGPTMAVDVHVQGRVIQKLTVPICREGGTGRSSQGQRAGRIDFAFRPQRSINWVGYRDRDDQTPAGQVLEGSLWQAGAEPSALVIGVSFKTADRILMNTIHIAYPDRRAESTITEGVTMATYPVR